MRRGVRARRLLRPGILTDRAWKAAPFLFGSGFCALVYQVAWQREFRLVFGASTAASAAVVAIFMGSLGAGGWVLGRIADRRADPWRMYARLEALVAITAALTPPLLVAVRWLYLGLGGSVVLGDLGGTALRLVLATLVLLPPMFLAGGTLPAAARAVETEADRRRGGLAVLYGVNTLGAVAGAMAATFALLELFGTRGTLWLACLVNLLVAVLARALHLPTHRGAIVPAAAAVEPATTSPSLVYTAAAVVGFAFFLMELVWYRMLGPILGGTVYTFGLILAVALFGIGLGGLLYAIAGRRKPPTVGAFAATCWAEAACIAAPLVMGDRVAALALRLRPVAPQSLADYLPGWLAVCAIVVLPAAIVAGAQFPLLVALLGRGRAEVGHQLGRAYAWNTAGAIAGALAGGFGLLPLLTAPGTWRAVAIGLAFTGVTAAVAGRAHRLTALACLSGTGAVAAAVLTVPGPTAAWRHSGIGAGRTEILDLGAPNALRAFVHQERRATFWEAEGVESSVAMQRKSALAFVVNGKIDGNARNDAPTQVMGGLIGALLHPAPRSALVIGLGTGSTAGWLAAVPSIERTDVIELEPSVVEIARACSPVNHAMPDNPRVHVRFGDAREVLMTGRGRYDIVFSEPSNPYRAGVASLFTREFYRSVRDRLQPGGLFLQWLQAYEVDDLTVRVMLATLASVFDSVEVWQTHAYDLVLIASAEPRVLDAAAFAARVRTPPFQRALEVAWRAGTPEAVLGRFIAGPAFVQAVAAEGWTPNTDDRNRVEFGFARSLGRRSRFRVEPLRQSARRIGAHRPVLRGFVDWDRVELERVSMYSAYEVPPPDDPAASPADRARAQAHGHYTSGRSRQAAESFLRQPRPPSGSVELAMVADGLAEAGDSAALPYIEALAVDQPVEAEAIRARLALAQRRPEDAAVALERALAAYRHDPWPSPLIMLGALTVAETLGQRRPDLAARAFAALAEPFAVSAIETQRLGSRLRIARQLPLREFCREALAALEPFVPWDAEALLYRRNCYEATSDPRAGLAGDDLEEFLSNDRPRTGAAAAQVE